MAEKIKLDMTVFHLGTAVIKFNLPIEFVDAINKAYDSRKENLPAHNDKLAGKIAEEKQINEILTPSTKNTFLWCFGQYLNHFGTKRWNPVLGTAWINEMKAGEYNPTHFHTGINSDIGLSSVLLLKRPDWYGVEVSREDAPANGWLEFAGGDQAPLSKSQVRVDAQVGEFYVFPYSLLHGVYPFNSTDEVRRTMSYNCDLIKKNNDT